MGSAVESPSAPALAAHPWPWPRSRGGGEKLLYTQLGSSRAGGDGEVATESAFPLPCAPHPAARRHGRGCVTFNRCRRRREGARGTDRPSCPSGSGGPSGPGVGGGGLDRGATAAPGGRPCSRRAPPPPPPQPESARRRQRLRPPPRGRTRAAGRQGEREGEAESERREKPPQEK